MVATDASASQIAHAVPHPRVTYLVARAEASGLAQSLFELVTVAQALHWFDHAAFFAEARRVLVPGGVLAAWIYLDPFLGDAPDLDVALQAFDRIVDPYWPPERRYTDSGYRAIAFPFTEVAAPELQLVMEPTLGELCGYLRTWSATRRYVEQEGRDPVLDVEAELLRSGWRDPSERRRLCWPLFLRVGRML